MRPYEIEKLVQKEDLRRWGNEWVENRMLPFLWIPDWKPFSPAARAAFFKDITISHFRK